MDTKKSTHWKDLASQLGLELPNSGELEAERPAAVEPEPLPPPPVSELPATPEVAPPPARRASSAPRARSGWSQLAEEFGIAGEEEPESAVPVEAEPVRAAYLPPERPVQEDFPRLDDDEPNIERLDSERLDGDQEDILGEGDSELAPAPRERRERSPKRRGGRRRSESRKPVSEPSPLDFLDDDEILKDIDLGEFPPASVMDFDAEPIDLDEEEGVEPESRDEDEERGRKRRRRRKRRGGREPRREGKARAESTPEDDAVEMDGAEPDLDDLAEDLEDSHGDEDGLPDDLDDESGKKPSHRGIVTWEQAVGMIVKANMETRRETRGGRGGGNDRPRSGPRGRHGGRRR